MAQGWTIDAAADTITFNEAPVNGAAVVVTETSAAAVGATDYWAFGAWNDGFGYPREVEFYSDRLVWAGTRQQPQTLWMTKSGSYDNFGRTVPLEDTDAITTTINARQVNTIKELLPLSDLVIMTTSTEWRLTTGPDGVVAPGKVGFKPQSYYGIADLSAQIAGATGIFVQGSGNIVRDLSYEFTKDGYTGNDLTIYAGHLVEDWTLVDAALQQAPYSAVWLVRSDGVLLSLTYVREQEVVGWAAHSTDGRIESVCTVPEGTQNALYVSVRRTINGVERVYVERLAERDLVDPRDAFFVDSGLTFDGRQVPGTQTLTGGAQWDEDEELLLTASDAVWTGASDVGDQVRLFVETSTIELGEEVTVREEVRVAVIEYLTASTVNVRPLSPVPESLRGAAVSWELMRDTVSGLGHLEGKVVAVLADGNVQGKVNGVPTLVVTGGSVTLDHPAAVVHVGLPYRSMIESLDVNIPSAETVRTQPKNITKVSLVVRETRGLLSGPDMDRLDEFKMREFEPYEDPIALYTGVMDVNVSNSWDRNGRFVAVQEDPLPATILALIPDVSVSGVG